MEFINDDIVELIDEPGFGFEVDYYPSRMCSCLDKSHGIPESTCKCNIGFYYGDKEINKIIKTNFNLNFLNSSLGLIYNGGCQITIPKFYNGVEQKSYTTITRGDIFVFKNKTIRNRDILTRGQKDIIYAFDVSEIISVSMKDNIYKIDEDFYISKENSVAGELTVINWKDGKGPKDGQSYSIEFICKMQFKVWDEGPFDRGGDNCDLPKRVKCTARKFVNFESNYIDSEETSDYLDY